MSDLSRALTQKERRSFEHRSRMTSERTSFANSYVRALRARHALGSNDSELALREDYVFLRSPIDDAEISDRKAPARALRPAATQISSSKGAALRFHLTCIDLAQTISRRGQPGHLPQLPLVTHSTDQCWTDLLVSAAVESGSGRELSAVRDKKLRTLQSALKTLSGANLITNTRSSPREEAKELALLHEGGTQNTGDPIRYMVPGASEPNVFRVPRGFISNGWVHALSDSEISLILMIAAGAGKLQPWTDDADLAVGEVAIPATVRLKNYGIHRDPFSSARKTLSWFGLVNVREAGRHVDGRAVGDDRKLHRLSLIPEGFRVDALSKIRETTARQLAR